MITMRYLVGVMSLMPLFGYVMLGVLCVVLTILKIFWDRHPS